jgi:Tol biopolymer transport system component
MIKHFLRCIFSIITVLGMTGCQSVWRKPIPTGEIVYQGEEVKNYPHYQLGFVDSNGKNNQIIKPNRQFAKPVWSVDGTFLYGLSSNEGTYYGYPAYWDLQKRRFGICSRHLPYFDQIQGEGNPENPYEVIVQDIFIIVVMDLSQCIQVRTLVDYSAQLENYSIAGFSYNYSKQELIYGIVLNQSTEPTYRLMHLNLKTGKEIQIGEGINPTWSPDGTKVAYIGLDGLYLIKFSGEKLIIENLVKQQIFDPSIIGSAWNSTPMPSWSPDGKWLVYHRCNINEVCTWEDTQIYKISSNGGDEIAIVQGGEFPSWRP